MFYLFLDFDGVLVPEQAYFYWDNKEDNERKNSKLSRAVRCCPIAISNLNYVCSQITELKIVVSSTWRIHFKLPQLKEILIEDGFNYPERVIDTTPLYSRPSSDLGGYSKRGAEIEDWLKESGQDMEDWIAIDDHDNDIDADHLLLTKQEVGFTILDAYSLIERFMPNWNRPLFIM